MSTKILVLSGEYAKGGAAIVDDGIYDWLSRWSWSVRVSNGRKHAKRNTKVARKHIQLWLHREIWAHINGPIPDGLCIDHINGDSLDNRLANLRLASHKENIRNRANKNKNNTSGYTGVFWDKSKNKWLASIKIDGRNKYLGRYLEKRDAAVAYNNAALEFFGEYASLNNIND